MVEKIMREREREAGRQAGRQRADRETERLMHRLPLTMVVLQSVSTCVSEG